MHSRDTSHPQSGCRDKSVGSEAPRETGCASAALATQQPGCGDCDRQTDRHPEPEGTAKSHARGLRCKLGGWARLTPFQFYDRTQLDQLGDDLRELPEDQFGTRSVDPAVKWKLDTLILDTTEAAGLKPQ